MEDQLLNFVAKFFDNLGATVKYYDKKLTVTNVPEKFQKFYGKKEPYVFTTMKEKSNEDVMYLEKGSYTLKTIQSFLENSGQTTLLRIDFKINPEEEIKKRVKLANCRITKLSPKKRYNMFFRFTFHTSSQYMNEREKVINEIYVHNGEVVNGDLNDYPVVEGSKRDVKIPDMKEPYFVAKERLKVLLEGKTQEVAEKLNLQLDKEIKRIERHFETAEKELVTNLHKAKEKLEELELEEDPNKIKRQKKVLQNINEKLNPEERLDDKERTIMIEKTKHGLNVNNKLFNTTLIYHPVFTYDAHLKGKDGTGVVELAFNPLLKTSEPVICHTCKKVAHGIHLCKNGHIVCKDCFKCCEACGKEQCVDCVKYVCELCGAKICKDCKTRCSDCGKLICKSHAKFDRVTGKIHCTRCLTTCPNCNEPKVGQDFKVSKKTNRKICASCFRKEMQESVLKELD